MAYEEPVVEVLGAERSGDTTTIRVRFVSGKVPADPLAPASLVSQPGHPPLEIPLHQLVDRGDGEVLHFESYGVAAPLPSLRERWLFRSWWMPQDLDLVMDTALAWQQETYRRTGDHEHCPLTWETIGPGDVGYHSSRGNWISVRAYEQYIRNDILRVRPTKGNPHLLRSRDPERLRKSSSA